jgi:hypothetical protein
MNRPLLLALAICIAAVAPLVAEGQPGSKYGFKVQELEIRKSLPEEISKLFDGGYYSATGTALRALLTVPDKQVLTIDAKASTLTSMTDDKGTDLTKAKNPGGFVPPWIEDFDTRITKDKKHLMMRMTVPGTPAPGATKINLKANLVVLCGISEKTVEEKNTELKVDKNVKIGSLILSTEKGFGDNFTNVLFTCEDAPRIKSVTFLDKDGQALRSNSGGIHPNFAPGRTDWICRYTIESKVDRVTVRVIYYEKMEKVNVPVDLQLTVGF